MSIQEVTAAPFRTEVEVAANAVIALMNAGLLKKGVTLQQVCDVVAVTPKDLRLASVRLERVVPRRLEPTEEPTRAEEPIAPARPDHEPSLPVPAPVQRLPLPPVAYLRDHAPQRGDLQPTRTLPRARKACAEAIFAQWRARGNLTCTRCGKPIDSGCDAVIEAAHHADQCAP